jgi:hypothetical protein
LQHGHLYWAAVMLDWIVDARNVLAR